MLEENMEVMLNPQYVIDKENKPKAVLLTISEWEQIVEDLEELDDIRAYDAAKAGPQDTIPFEQAVREIEEESK
jgi:PHD/YefM family antitoxin component YafN of YafNO toxin-antitoxin module